MFGSKQKERKSSDLDVFIIYDSKVGSYERPHFERNGQVVMREILNMFRDPAQAKNKYLVNAEDYSVYRVGTLDVSSGKLECFAPEHVCNMHDLRFMAQREGSQNVSGEPDVGIVPT